jgi:hypothetical protein
MIRELRIQKQQMPSFYLTNSEIDSILDYLQYATTPIP